MPASNGVQDEDAAAASPDKLDEEKQGFPITALREIGALMSCRHENVVGIREVVVGDTLGYQGMNARSAKETLMQRTSVLEEYQAAVRSTTSKRRNIERLKASTNIRPERVDEALEDMEEVLTSLIYSNY